MNESITLDAQATTRQLKSALIDGDATAVAALFTPDGIMRSPISQHAQFHGRAAIKDLFDVVLTEVHDIQFEREISQGDERVLLARWKVGRQPAHEAVWLRVDQDGLIAEMVVFVRPLPGLTAMAAALASALAARRAGWRARVIGFVLRPLAVLAVAADRAGARFVGVGPR